MRPPIRTNLHAILDYASALIIATSPWTFFIDHVPGVIPISLGVGLFIFLMSLFTAYEGGVVRSIPMKMHLALDVLIGIFLAMSPWLLDFAAETFLFQLVVGVGVILVASSTYHKTHIEVLR